MGGNLPEIVARDSRLGSGLLGFDQTREGTERFDRESAPFRGKWILCVFAFVVGLRLHP
jgi:hypothetical protein